MGSNQAQTQYEEDFVDRARRSDGKLFTNEIATDPRADHEPDHPRKPVVQPYVTVDFLGPPRLASNYIESVLDEVPVPVGASISLAAGSFVGTGAISSTTTCCCFCLRF
jgi:hydrophobic/amphiphilic exporter-1 (mainly G- bacteria), HAE1 family